MQYVIHDSFHHLDTIKVYPLLIKKSPSYSYVLEDEGLKDNKT